MQKIFLTNKPVYYVDCFAGKGRFDDGTEGSPLIALKIIDDCIQATRAKNPKIESCYIDLNYAQDLENNLSGHKNIKVVSGKYEETIMSLLENRRGQNVFLYIDPYGIKALNCGFFDSFATLGFSSIELLINLNSFGFMREACRAMKLSQSEIKEFDEIVGDDLVEYDPSKMDSTAESIQTLTDIAGGNYWQNIVTDFQAQNISCYEAEMIFSNEYCKRLKQVFKYVLNMPIRLKEFQQPKYRMIHVTNHEDGCILMFNNICNRCKKLGAIQGKGQKSLFEQTPENEIVDKNDAKESLKEHLKKYKNDSKLSVVIAEFLSEYGILCTPQILQDILLEFEGLGTIEVLRDPPFTPTGRPSKFFVETSSQKVQIRSKL
jgi:three-Cys-motif partner protein